MNLDNNKDNVFHKIAEALISQGSEGISSILETIYNGAMKIEREQALGAQAYERSDERKGYANGYKNKTYHTRAGPLQLQIPKVRGLSFYPGCLDKGSRSEKALKSAIAEMYINGVSTRKVQSITQELCGFNISSTQVSNLCKELDVEFEIFRNRPIGKMAYVIMDALYLKVRHNGSVIDMACLIAYGVNNEGKREILGASMSLSEAEVHWREFFMHLQSRGLHGVKLIISDAHPGMEKARQTVFPSIPWQRCQFHLAQNALQYAPKKAMKGEISEAIRAIFNSRNIESAIDTKEKIIEEFAQKAPEFVKWLDKNIDEGLTCFNFPKEHQKRIRTSNGIERVNREVKRRTRVAVLFPNAESALRLVTGVLCEIHEDWVCGKTYLDMSLLSETKEKEIKAA